MFNKRMTSGTGSYGSLQSVGNWQQFTVAHGASLTPVSRFLPLGHKATTARLLLAQFDDLRTILSGKNIQTLAAGLPPPWLSWHFHVCVYLLDMMLLFELDPVQMW